MNMEDCERSSRVRGYHIYKAISNSVTIEELRFEREPDTNRSNRYAVTVKRWDNHVICQGNITSLFPFPKNRK